MVGVVQSDVLVIGGGLAGLVTALECLRAGRRVTLVDRDTPERLGGLALWAFGGMALVDTPLQRRMKLKDSPEIALRDWIRFGELGEQDVLPLQWARYYVEHSRAEVHDWLIASGLKFMPAVNWVERGLQGNGNSLPRYHIVWGTSRHLTLRMIELAREAGQGGRLTLLSRHRVTTLERNAGALSGAVAVNEADGTEVRLTAPVVVLATGGINGSHDETRANWPRHRPMPATMLNGAHPFADGKLHHAAAALGGRITHAGEMWNYAAGFPHPLPPFEGRVLESKPEAGDVVVFKTPVDDKTDYIKRVIGLPGDRVQVKGGRLYINGAEVPREAAGEGSETCNSAGARPQVFIETLPEGRKHMIWECSDNYPLDNTQEFVVPPEHFFMMGDNRDNSNDSRQSVGYVPAENLIGRAEFLFFSHDEKFSWNPLEWPDTIRWGRLLNGID